MRTLSGRQPWWWAILHAGKRIENRTRCLTRTPGPVLLHASSHQHYGYYVEASGWMLQARLLTPGAPFPLFDEIRRGGIVGRATIRGVIPPHDYFAAAEWAEKIPGLDLRWWMRDQWGHVLADVVELPFTPCKGSLGLFNFDERSLRAA